MWTHNDVVARYVFFLRTEIYYYSLLVSIKKFSPLLDWDSPISRWRARAFPSSPSLSLPLLHTLFLSLSLPLVIFYLNRILTLPSRCSVMWFYFLSVRRFFLFASFRSNDSTSFPLCLSFSASLCLYNATNTHLYYLYYLYVYIYFFIYLFFIHTQTKPSPVSACESSVLDSFLSLFFCSLVVCSVLFFFTLFRVCVYVFIICMYSMYIGIRGLCFIVTLCIYYLWIAEFNRKGT